MRMYYGPQGRLPDMFVQSSIKSMLPGERVWIFGGYMSVDDDGLCWMRMNTDIPRGREARVPKDGRYIEIERVNEGFIAYVPATCTNRWDADKYTDGDAEHYLPVVRLEIVEPKVFQLRFGGDDGEYFEEMVPVH